MENKAIFKTLSLLFFTFIFSSCGNLDNPKERNKIVCTDSISSVKDSLNLMNKILLKTGRKFTTIYGIDVDMDNIDRNENEFYLYVDDSLHSPRKVGMITDSLLYKSKWLKFIDFSDRKHFINLALYLYRNHLSACYIENELALYTYRGNIYMADKQMDLVRFLVFAKFDEIDLNAYKILDSSKNLYLLANKEAKIWSSK